MPSRLLDQRAAKMTEDNPGVTVSIASAPDGFAVVVKTESSSWSTSKASWIECNGILTGVGIGLTASRDQQ